MWVQPSWNIAAEWYKRVVTAGTSCTHAVEAKILFSKGILRVKESVNPEAVLEKGADLRNRRSDGTSAKNRSVYGY